MQATKAAAEALDMRPPLDWIAGQVFALLSEYYTAELPASVRDVITARWIKELRDFPAWAIEDACDWWVSRNNRERKRKPVSGDIGARCQEITAPLRAAKTQIERYERYGDNPPSVLRA